MNPKTSQQWIYSYRESNHVKCIKAFIRLKWKSSQRMEPVHNKFNSDSGISAQPTILVDKQQTRHNYSRLKHSDIQNIHAIN